MHAMSPSPNISPPSPMSSFSSQFSTYYALLWKCLIRRCKSPLTVFLEFGIPLAIFGLFSWAGSLLSTDTTDYQVPNDAYSISTFGGDMYENLRRGYTPETVPTCTWGTYVNWQNKVVEGWLTGDEDKLGSTRILLDCKVHSLNTWALDESNCEEEGEVIFDKCQKKLIGIAPASGLSGADLEAVNTLIDEHEAWLKATWPESIGAYDLVKRFDSDAKMNSYVRDNKLYGVVDGDSPALAFGLVWHGASPNYEYSIRLNETSVLDPTVPPFDHYVKNADFSFDSAMCEKRDNRRKGLDSASDLVRATELGACAGLYVGSGFAGIQATAVDAFLYDYASRNEVSGNVKPLDFRVNAGVAGFPAPTKSFNVFWTYVGKVFAFLLFVSFIYPFYNILRQICEEKELKLTEGMKIMGASSFAIMSSWWSVFILQFFCLSIFMTFVGKTIFVKSDQSIIFFYFFMFFMASTSFCYFLTTFFSEAKKGGIIGIMLFIAGAVFAQVPGLAGPNSGLQQKFFFALHPAVPYFLATDSFAFFEANQVGITQNTIRTRPDPDTFSFADAFAMQVLDIFIYGFLTWYLDKVIPSEFGTNLPPHFLLMPSYWLKGEIYGDKFEAYQAVSTNSSSIETVSDELRAQESQNCCVQISKLAKAYDTNAGRKVAVHGLDLTFYKDQISCLLGHNGAGKTSTISMLTGLVKPSSGQAKIGPYNLSTELIKIRQTIGVCPQHDVLFRNLTVYDHLWIFAKFKNIPNNDIKKSIDDILEAVGLKEKKYWLAEKMSGGQKRKLSLAIAFIGNPSVVFLDEPTSGMDPYSRRFTWDVIRKMKKDRVIVLTTHFMDEADLLGDRIAIMSQGELRCCGSSLFLKKEFGVGYNLVLEKKATTGGAYSNTAIEKLVTSYAKDAKLLSSVGMELSYQLPLESASSFPSMLTALDSKLDEFGIETYGVSVTTLEEVFLRIAHEAKNIDESNAKEKDSNLKKERVVYSKLDSSLWRAYFVRHLSAMLHKRAILTKRDRLGWLIAFILPIILIAAGMAGTLIELTLPSYPDYAIDVGMNEKFDTPVFYNLDTVSDCGLAVNWCEAKKMNASDVCDWSKKAGGFFTQPPDTGHIAPPYDTYFEQLFGEDANYQPMPLCSVDKVEDLVASVNEADERVEWIGVEYDGDEVGGHVGVRQIAEALESSMDEYGGARFGALLWTSTPSDASDNPLYDATSPSSDYFNNNEKFVEYVAMVNFTSAHALPAYMAMASEMILKHFDPEATIRVRNYPFPRTVTEQASTASEALSSTIFMILFSLPFVPASFASFAIRDRTTKAKHIQMVSGVTPFTYWLSSFLWDYTCYQVSVWALIILLFCFGIDALTKSDAIGPVIGLLLSWGGSIATFSYCTSFLFSTPLQSLGFLIMFNFIFGYLAPVATYVIGIFSKIVESEGTKKSLTTAYDVMKGVGHFLPSYNLGFGLTRIQYRDILSSVDGRGDNPYQIWSENICRDEVLWMIGLTFLYFSLTMMIEYVFNNPIVSAFIANSLQNRKAADWELKDLDQDVQDENAKVQRMADGRSGGKDAIVVHNMKKQYGLGWNLFGRTIGGDCKVAVKGVSFTVEGGQCFGLLGVNGAGKTSTLGMMCGEFPPSSGTAWLSDRNITQNVEEVRRLIGFCPQFDAVYALMTGREHLQMYARLKGIAEEDIAAVVDEQILRMDLTEYCDRTAGGYSGGNKRKLSVACALIGDPAIVFLDEPSTGMDPLARRYMWSIINDISNSGTTAIILTTHSMEECEALCGKIGIMVGGHFKCIGSSQRLKNRFGQGYQAEIKVLMEGTTSAAISSALALGGGAIGSGVALGAAAPVSAEDISRVSEERVQKILAFLTTEFGSEFKLLERQGAKLRVSLPKNRVSQGGGGGGRATPLGEIFGLFEKNKEILCIQDYSLSQTSLEQIFNSFAKTGDAENGAVKGSGSEEGGGGKNKGGCCGGRAKASGDGDNAQPSKKGIVVIPDAEASTV